MADDLLATQHWMQAAITCSAPPAPDAGAVVAGSAALSAQQRLELYRRGYRSRLVGCLRETHPGLRHALGDEVFEAFALDYLEAHPARGYTLARLGAGWADHLEATRPQDERWPEFVIDLARLERAFAEVYDGPGVEGQALPGSDDLPAEPDLDVTIEPVACLRLLAARYPVAAYLSAVRRGERPALPAPASAYAALTRRDWVVTITGLGAREHGALEAILRGEHLRDAARAAAVDDARLWGFVRAWADRGFLHAVHVREPVLLSPSEVVR